MRKRFVPTMDREFERERIYKFLKQAKHNHIIKRDEIKEISKLPEDQWFLWAAEKLDFEENKTLLKVGRTDFAITFSTEAFEKFKVTKEIDWNEIPELEFNQMFSNLDFESTMIVIDGQLKFLEILTKYFNDSLKKFKENNIDIKSLSEEINNVNSRYTRMRELIMNKMGGE